jgi:predicted DNA-binding transcriptional regulator AlpA
VQSDRQRPRPRTEGVEKVRAEHACSIQPATPTPAEAIPRLLYRAGEVAAAVGLSRAAFDRGIAAGRIPRADVKVGRIRLWSRESLVAWIGRGGRL